MATDIVTFSVNKGADNVNGRLIESFADATFSDSYVSGGYTFPAALNTQYGQLRIANLIGVEKVATNTAGVTYDVSWDSEAETLVVLVAGVQVAGNVDISTITLTLKLTGTR